MSATHTVGRAAASDHKVGEDEDEENEAVLDNDIIEEEEELYVCEYRCERGNVRFSFQAILPCCRPSSPLLVCVLFRSSCACDNMKAGRAISTYERRSASFSSSVSTLTVGVSSGSAFCADD